MQHTLPDFEHAHSIWEYLEIVDSPQTADAIIALGRDDFRIAEKAKELYDAHYAPVILLTGGRGRKSGRLNEPEAKAFESFLLAAGVCPSCLIVEPHSTNTTENLSNGMMALQSRLQNILTVIIVTHSPHSRRALATAKRIAPEVKFISCPDGCSLHSINTAEYKNDVEEIIGEVDRLHAYSIKEYIANVSVPEHIDRLSDIIRRQLNDSL